MYHYAEWKDQDTRLYTTIPFIWYSKLYKPVYIIDSRWVVACSWVGGTVHYNKEWKNLWVMKMTCVLILLMLTCVHIFQNSLNYTCKMCSIICSHVFLNDDLKRQEEKNYRQNGLPFLKQDVVKGTALSPLPKTTE